MPAVFGDHSLPSLDRPFFRLALIGTLVACLALAGCGRKGPLDPPPGASATGEAEPPSSGLLSPMTSPIGSGSGGKTSSAEPALGPDGRPLAPKGPKRPFVLDGMLN